MKFFQKNCEIIDEPEITLPESRREFVIEFLREQSDKEFEKIIKIVEIYREADEKVKIVELGSKKAVKESQKEEKEFGEELDELLLGATKNDK